MVNALILDGQESVSGSFDLDLTLAYLRLVIAGGTFEIAALHALNE